MARSAGGTDVPEFHIVVKRPSRKGPLAPFRFAISVAAAFVLTLSDLRAVLLDGAPGDAVLARALIIGVFTWVVLSVLNKVLAAAPPDPDDGSPATNE